LMRFKAGSYALPERPGTIRHVSLLE
jgi:hypothetical protein